MRRPLRELVIDCTIVGIATFGWCVVAPTTVIACELVELVEVLRARGRELLAPIDGDAS
ncbi:MAG: hypothetical protein IT379_39530 [Deltaproteobacteria bacterium]|nr:hypothetical protein [Deltaproteobacteria bacterium]